jgi:PTH1 family peptidyl-tRNA hydrolase
MKALVGLGNPGPRYRNTRHNVGWHVLDRLASSWSGGRPEKARHAEIVRCNAGGEIVLLVKPQTFMNDSGLAVRALVEKDNLGLDDVLVFYDDLDLVLGRIRVRPNGSAGGHRGILSIQQQLAASPRVRKAAAAAAGDGGPGPNGAGASGKNGKPEPPPFARVKIGIGRPPAGVDPIDFVLTTFTPDERALIDPAIDLAVDAASCWLHEGVAAAMNRFNGAQPVPAPRPAPAAASGQP